MAPTFLDLLCLPNRQGTRRRHLHLSSRALDPSLLHVRLCACCLLTGFWLDVL